MKLPDSSASRVLSIPELIRSITYDWSLGDKVKLSQVSRQTFAILVPEIWRNVYGVEKLICLISSASAQYKTEAPPPFLDKMIDSFRVISSQDPLEAMNQPPTVVKPKNKFQAITLDHTLDYNQFDRFDIYAPLVKSIDVYGYNGFPSGGYFSLSGWPLLISEASNRSRALLPNLEDLSIMTLNDPAQTADVPKWIEAFGSLSVTTVSMEIPDCNWLVDNWTMSQSELLDTIGLLAKHCPNTQSLPLCPRQLTAPHDPGNLPLTSPSTYTHWYYHVKPLANLRHISLSNGWLSSSSLVAISHIKTLKSLHLYLGTFGGFDETQDINFYMEDAAFEALRSLSLKNIASTKANELLKVRRLFKSITELEIDYSLAEERCEGFKVFKGLGDWLIKSLLPSITNSPRLEVLRIHEYTGEHNQDMDYMLKMPQGRQAIQAMSQVPLKHIEFQTIHLDHDIGIDLGVMWSNVTELLLPIQTGSLQELALFATIPRLERLLVCLDLDTDFTPPDSHRYKAPLRVLESKDAPNFEFALRSMKHDAQMLLKLWPSLTEIVWGDPDLIFFHRFSDGWSKLQLETFQLILTACVAKRDQDDNELKSSLESFLRPLLPRNHLESFFEDETDSEASEL